MAKVHAEIEYTNAMWQSYPSDICPPNHCHTNITQEYREFLHKCLGEWFDNANGTGVFYIKAEDFEIL